MKKFVLITQKYPIDLSRSRCIIEHAKSTIITKKMIKFATLTNIKIDMVDDPYRPELHKRINNTAKATIKR